MIRDFDKWLKTFRDSINGFDYYTDFAKVYENAAKLKDEINILNLLVNADDIEAEFKRVIAKYPECLKAIPILLAVRGHELYCQDENAAITYRFDKITQTPEQYSYLMRKTGLFDLLRKHIISNLNDYVTGVEAGLDSNGRKNRGGHQMERLVEGYIRETGAEYCKEFTTADIINNWNITLPSDFATNKRWDFAVRTPANIYVFETNFYTSGGSKLNETARSYKLIAEQAGNINGFVFVWITDGNGWNSAKHSLHETFSVLDTLYNIADLQAGILNTLLR